MLETFTSDETEAEPFRLALLPGARDRSEHAPVACIPSQLDGMSKARAFLRAATGQLSVFAGTLHAVDHENLDRRPLRLQLEAKLFLECGEDRRRVLGGRRPAWSKSCQC